MKMLFLLLLCASSSPVPKEIHVLNIYYTASSKAKNNTEFELVLDIDGNVLGSCDHEILKTNYDWGKKMLNDYREVHEFYTVQCFQILPRFFDYKISSVRKDTSQPEGVHIFQRIDRCNFDEDTGEVDSSMRFGYDGEDFLELDLDKLSWVALSPQAAQTKRTWETEIVELHFYKELLTYKCPLWLKISLDYGKSVLRRTDLPSVSLLQKTPSSPIRCHATGFYPYRAHLFWRKDGQETHEDVEHGDILPNDDGSFQMMTDLNVSSINIEDWRRFDCVFHLSSAADKVIIKLDKSVIKTNYDAGTSIILIKIYTAEEAVIIIIDFYFISSNVRNQSEMTFC
uniref:Ig-like domain-containing protein n=1 Tax=Poecilia formosa TaxID=48698 RepID=A0A096LV57_POEFO